MNDKSDLNLIQSIKSTLDFQFKICMQILEMHLDKLEDEEYLWKPTSKGLHIVNKNNKWSVDWPETEEYTIGPPNIAWITWHIRFWWSMVLNNSFGAGTLTREDVKGLGSSKDTIENIKYLSDKWIEKINSLSDDDLISSKLTKWPFEDRPFHELVAWLNLELMKNASEIGYCRFLYGVKDKINYI
ncbi:DinB family protein [Clostridium sp. UBA1652]|uniref:DinB family protein n=1 Tax=Clostridium sp. UBA1652 TaxID=1946348 RepID=UPI00257DB7F2|nr:DinB family protein [Clostridium sp. UBA1652]